MQVNKHDLDYSDRVVNLLLIHIYQIQEQVKEKVDD